MLTRLTSTALSADQPASPRAPNIVIIFADDLGYADLGCFGGRPRANTPRLDRMAKEGRRFTDFYVAQPVCSSSRAALLTGCYPNRIGIVGALGPKNTHGIHDNEVTLAELCRSRGYATGMVGKWHLGHHPPFLPTRHGFETYYGLPYSNDMWPKHPTTPFPDLPLIEQDRVIGLNPDQTRLTTDYTDRAVRFIEAHKDRAFFLYVAHSMPHVPLFVSDQHAGRTKAGLYADVLAEIDWSVGRILDTLQAANLEDHTLVLFTSDNGPWLLYGDHSGSALPLREGKATTFEGGIRVPCIARWPGKIPADSVCREPAATIDVLPTIARLIDAPLPEHKIDGRDIWPLLTGDGSAQSPHEALYFYWLNHLQAVRSGPWKLHLPHSYPQPAPAGSGGQPGKYRTRQIDLALYNLEQDAAETTDLSGRHPDVVARLLKLAERARQDLGDSATNTPGSHVREPGRLPAP